MNGYPLVYSDSGTYIGSGYGNKVPVDRPIMYGIMARALSLGYSLWGVVIGQAIIVSAAIFLLFRKFGSYNYFHLQALLATAMLTLTTGLSSYTSLIMPDVFTAIVIVGAILMTLPSGNGKHSIWLRILLLPLVITHVSNLLVITTIFGIVLIAWLWARIRKSDFGMIVRPLFTFTVACWMFILLINSAHNEGFVLSRAGHVFPMGNLAEGGILQIYLEENCDSKKWNICKHRAAIPRQAFSLLWESSSALYKDCEGEEWPVCWTSKKKEYNAILSDLYGSTRYWPMLIEFHMSSFLKQLTTFGTGIIIPMQEGSPVMPQIENYFAQELSAYKSSRQSGEIIDYTSQNVILNYLVICSLLLVTAIMAVPRLRNRISIDLRRVIWLVASGLVANAFVCSAFASVVDRYQGRVIWMVPLFALIVVANLFSTMANPNSASAKAKK